MSLENELKIREAMPLALDKITQSAKKTSAAFQDLQTSVERGLNYKPLRVMSDELTAIERKSVAASSAIQSISTTNQSLSGMFSHTGIEHFKNEIMSAKTMLNKLNESKMRVTFNTDGSIVAEKSVRNITSAKKQLGTVKQQMDSINANRINIDATKTNSQLKNCSGQLQAVTDKQLSLNRTMNAAEGLKANKEYDKLNQSINTTDKLIKGNVEQQNKFTDSISQSQKSIGNLMAGVRGKMKDIAIEALKAGVEMSDKMTQTHAKLNLIVDDNNSVNTLERKMFEVAQNTRRPFMETADMVTNLGTRASGSFKTNDELLAFSEQVGKSLVISGADDGQRQSVNSTLTEAMSAGTLDSSGLETLTAGAQPIVSSIQRYLEESGGIDASNLEALAEQGVLTAEVIKNAMFYATAETNAQFDAVPMTWGDVWTDVMNRVLMVSQPVLDLISCIAQNWKTLEPIVFSLGISVMFLAVAMGIQTFMTSGAILTMQAFFTTLLANPLFWIAMLIGMVVYGIYKWVQSVGGLKIAWLIVVDKLMSGMDQVHIFFLRAINGVLTNFGKLVYGMHAVKNGVLDAIGEMKVKAAVGLQNMVNNSIDYINKFIGTLNNILGLNIKAVDKITISAKIEAEEEAAKQARSEELEKLSAKFGEEERLRQNEISKMENDAKYRQMVRQTQYQKERERLLKDQEASESDYTNLNGNDLSGVKGIDSPSGYSGGNDQLNGIADNVGNISNNVSASSEELRYLRDIAERDAINRFTTAEIKVEQVNHNTVNGRDHDLAGIVDEITQDLEEALSLSAQKAVYA